MQIKSAQHNNIETKWNETQGWEFETVSDMDNSQRYPGQMNFLITLRGATQSRLGQDDNKPKLNPKKKSHLAKSKPFIPNSG